MVEFLYEIQLVFAAKEFATFLSNCQKKKKK